MASEGRTVLVCVDASPIAENAFDFYVNNIWKEGDNVFVATKAEFNISFPLTSPFGQWSEEQIKDLSAQSKKCQDGVDILTSNFADKMRAKKIRGNAIALTGEGKPAEALLDKAREIKANLIVVGTRGLGKIKRAWMGSTSDCIVKHAPCPVIVVRPDNEAL